MTSPAIIVFAYSNVGHACLDFLLKKGENVVCVYTHEDKPGENLWFPSVKKLAQDHGVPVRIEENLDDKHAFTILRSYVPALIFSFYYRNLIPGSVLDLAALGAYNMHGSLLPRYRGRAPVNWAVVKGETETGATLHAMVAKADAGDIIDQERVAIGPDDTAAEVQSAVAKAAVVVLARQIDNLKAGKAPRIPQDSSRASYFGRRSPADGEINWNMSAQQVHNLVRAVTHPYPGAFGDVLGEKTWIWKTRLRQGSGGQARSNDGDLIITCGDGNEIEVLSLQREGGPEMSGVEFMKRYAMVQRGKL